MATSYIFTFHLSYRRSPPWGLPAFQLSNVSYINLTAMTNLIKIALCLLPIVLATIGTPEIADARAHVQPDYQLAVSFDLKRHILTGTSRITIKAGETLTLDCSQLTITGILLKRQDATAADGEVTSGKILTVTPSTSPRELFVSYTFQPADDEPNLISLDAITLLSGWYPLPESKRRYQLSATLPEDFIAISESETFPLAKNGDTITAALNQPLAAIHFSAARYATSRLAVRKGLDVHTLFFPEDRKLAKDYLEKARNYILRYENEIGPYPYGHYAVVANRNPTGLGMPTFTLLGQSVLRLPFIKDTSLGHEILHSWFGNSVDVDSSHGNWCEGLTSYLADHTFRHDLGEGAEYRKEAIMNYLSYVHEDNSIPLSSFIDAGHSQPEALGRRAVGYSRAMMFFHELHERLGHANFMKGVRALYSSHRYNSASWEDLRLAFTENSNGMDLTTFFTERLTRTDIPAFHPQKIQVQGGQDTHLLTFLVVQETEQPYSLKIPVIVHTTSGQHLFTVTAEQQETKVELQLPARPLSFTLDPDYTLLRQLDPAERPAVWSNFLGSDRRLIIIQSRKDESLFRPLLKQLGVHEQSVKYADEINNSQLRDADLLLLGLDQPAVQNLFATPNHSETGFTLDVRRNPLHPDRVAVLVSSSAETETAAVAHRLSHYGKYGYLRFSQGRLADKRIPESVSGIVYTLEELPSGGATSQIDTFGKIAHELARHDVIYIGENHTSASDHLLQFRLIETIAGKVPELSIGMEMFPTSSQEALNEYVLGDGSMTEQEFLKASGYFEVWQYDYRYFRDIFALARAKKIPVIGLNLEKDIVSTVYRTGGTDEISPVSRKSLPAERDLDMKGYSERLLLMHAMHEQGGHGSGMVSGFIQAQAIWDESMAANIVKHLNEHPGRKMVVLAGNGHTRKDFGIPPRVTRRSAVEQAVVINVTEGQVPVNIADIADYFFFSEPAELEESLKMGVMLQERQEDNRQYVEVSDFSPDSKAADAGLRKGDILKNIAGFPVATMADVRIAMFDTPAGKVNVKVERKVGSNVETHSFNIPLIQPTPTAAHP